MRKTRAWGWLVLLLAGLVGCGGGVQGGEESSGETGGFVREAQQAPMEQELQAWRPEARQGRTLWSWHPHGPNVDALRAVATDSHGNVYAWGDFIDFLDDPAGRIESPSELRSLLLLKFRPDGKRLWARVFAPPPGGESVAFALAVDPQDNILLAGFQDREMDFGGGPLSPGAFLVKLDERGRHVWSRAFALTEGFLEIRALTTDESGNIALAAGLNGTVDLGDGPVSAPSPFGFWGTLAKFSPGGRLRWVDVATDGPMPYLSVAADSSNQLYVAGGGLFAPPFVRRYSPRGEVAWTRALEGTEGQAQGVTVCGDRVVLTGIFSGRVRFAGKVLESPPDGFSAGFIAAWTTTGREKWAHSVGDWGRNVAADAKGDVVLAGQFGSPDVFYSLFIAKYDRDNGRLRWVRTFTPGPLEPTGIATSKDGASSVVGFFTGTVVFNDGTVTTSEFASDPFLIHLAP